MMSAARFLTIVVPSIAIFGLCGCEAPSRPPMATPELRFGESTTGEIATGDSALYQLAVQAGQSFVIIVQSSDGAIRLDIYDAGGNAVGFAIAGPGPNNAATGWGRVTASVSGTYGVHVRTQFDGQGGHFTLKPTLVNASPEHASALIQLNDTVTDALDGPADVDEFTLNGQAGQEVNVFLQELGANGGPLSATLSAVGAPSADPSTASVGASAPTTDLEAAASGRVILPVTGQYRFRVQRPTIGDALLYNGAYRFQIYLVNRAPERASAALVPGDTLTSESVDHVGDVDEFTIVGTPGASFDVFLEASASAHRLQAEIITNPDQGVQWTAYASPGEPLLSNHSGTFSLPPTGRAKVTVYDKSNGGLYRGAYRLFVQPVGSTP